MKTKTVKKFRKRPPRVDKSKLNAQNIERIERKYRVVKLRRDGYTIPEIAMELGCSEQTVRQDIIETLQFTISETAETVEENRQLQVNRLDGIIKTYLPLALNSHKEQVIDPSTGKMVIVEQPPSVAFANLVLATEAQRAKLLALSVPETKKLEVSGIREYVGVDVDKV